MSGSRWVQLGHSNLGTTDRYIRHIAPQELIEAMQKREWVLGSQDQSR